MQWFQIQVQVVDEALKEAITSYFFDLGAEGVSETLEKGVSQGLCACFPKEKQDPICQIISNYFNDLKSLSSEAQKIQWRFSDVIQDNWAEKYKEFYKAQKLTDRFFLRPQWDTKTPLPKDMFSLILDPGQAFGTGLHQSTRLSMRLIEETAALYPELSPLKVLDVGTGTGILAIVAAKLGFKEITAIDNDLDAVRVARENFLTNGTVGVHLSSQALSSFETCFDMIVPNILLETHFELCQDYQRLLKPGGVLILAGLLGGQIPSVEEQMESLDFVLVQKSFLQEWAAVSYTLRPRS